MQRGVDPQRLTPADAVEEPLRRRPENRTGEASEEGQRRHRAAVARPRQLMQRRERRVVQACRHRHAGQRPAQEKQRKAASRCDQRQRDRAEDRPPRKHEAPALRIDESTDRGRDDSGNEQADRERAEKPRRRDAELAAHRFAEHRDGIEERAPGDDLRDAERGYQPRQPDRCSVLAGARHSGNQVVAADCPQRGHRKSLARDCDRPASGNNPRGTAV